MTPVAGRAVVDEVDPCEDPAWAELAARRDGGGLFVSPPWLRALAAAYGFRPRARVVRGADGALVGGIVWVTVRDALGTRHVSVPFSDRSDPVADGPGAWQALVPDGFPGDGEFTVRALEPGPACVDPRFRVVDTLAWHATALDGSPERAWAALAGPARRNVAAARRRGVRVILRTDRDAVHLFHALHVRTRKTRYRLLAPPRELFDRIRDEFAPFDGVVTAVATAADRPIAAAVFLRWGDTVYYKYGASESATLSLRPNDALFWAGIEHAVHTGARSVDWGVSDLDQPDLVAFKRKWATEERRLLVLRRGVRDGRADVADMLRAATELLTDPDVPDAVTARGGAAFYRYFC